VPVSAINRPLPGREAEGTFAALLSDHGTHTIGLSIDGLMGFGRLSREICRGRWNVAMPLWELEVLPRRKASCLARFDALWAPSSFVREALAHATGRHVDFIPHPIHVPSEISLVHAHTGPLRILFFFDFDSSPVRKNPEAAVQAFQMAFPRREDVQLTIKTRGGADAGRRAWLLEQASRDSRIAVIDRTLPSAAVARMMREHDVFLSLHRSEGFGLGCAEALAVGNVVVATDYGGTRDFVDGETGFPVSWKRVDVGQGDYVATPGGSWADPSIEHAAEILRAIYDGPDAARARAIRGYERLRQTHSVEAVGRKIRQRLMGYGV
jgi:glycosyltransferase involved in cell wall biosynthesis